VNIITKVLPQAEKVTTSVKYYTDDNECGYGAVVASQFCRKG